MEGCQKQSRTAQLVFIRRIFQQLYSLGIRCFFVAGATFEVQALEGIFIGKEHSVIKGELRIELVTEHNVTQFMGHDHGEGSLIGQDIEEATTDNNGVSDGERFQRRSKQDPAANVGLQVDIISYQ